MTTAAPTPLAAPTRPVEPIAEQRAEARLPAPADLSERQARPDPVTEHVHHARDAIRDVLHGRDPVRLVVVVGPCSIHDQTSALEYADRLARIAHETRDALLLVMRTYFEKPRTRVGWKGFLNDPHLDGSCDLNVGLERARRLLLAINARGLPCGAELLDPIAARYLEDLLAWGCIGARTCESQIHRELASGLDMPVGFKNTTDGNVSLAHDAMATARHGHSYLGIDASGAPTALSSRGNPDVHLVLRGGGGVPNHDAESVAWAATRARQMGLRRPVWVDCSHGNSHKNHHLQGFVCRQILEQIRGGHGVIGGLMLESFLEAGRQDWSPRERPLPGVSLTDACIGWDETRALLLELAEGIRSTA